MENKNIEKILQKIDLIKKEQSDRTYLLEAICKLLKQEIYHYDWVGFYLLDHTKNMLLLGPYAGKPTDHTRIPVGKGVCGQVAENKETMIVQDVSKMDNYIACSMDVQSEIVVPILLNGHFVAEIDIDSHSPAPFSSFDKQLLEKIADEIAYLFDEK